MKLTKADIEQLKAWGFAERDIPQIQDAANKTKYEIWPRVGKCGVRTVLKWFGRETCLSGIARSAFHWTATRNDEGHTMRVDFDSSAIFR